MAKKTFVWLTTVDNPFDPFNQQSEWFVYDALNNTKCCNLVADFANVTDMMADSEVEYELERTIDEIVANDPTNRYIKVVREFDVDENEVEDDEIIDNSLE